jgi:hypothetical protein
MLRLHLGVGGVDVRDTVLQAGRTGVRPDEIIDFFSINLILSAAPGPGVYLVSNRNEYQKIFLRVKCGRRVVLTTLLPSVSRSVWTMWDPQHFTAL